MNQLRNEFIVIHNPYMKEAAVTIRIPEKLKRQLSARARQQHRSLSAQVVADLETVLEAHAQADEVSGTFLGLFEGTSLPSEADIEEMRNLLWGRLGERQNRHG